MIGLGSRRAAQQGASRVGHYTRKVQGSPESPMDLPDLNEGYVTSPSWNDPFKGLLLP